jgi:hypothetical protein
MIYLSRQAKEDFPYLLKLSAINLSSVNAILEEDTGSLAAATSLGLALDFNAKALAFSNAAFLFFSDGLPNQTINLFVNCFRLSLFFSNVRYNSIFLDRVD